MKGLDYFTDQRNWYFANCRLSINGLFLLSDLISRILKRYDTYMETTKPVLDFYSKKSNFYEIDGDDEIDQISSKIEQILSV